MSSRGRLVLGSDGERGRWKSAGAVTKGKNRGRLESGDPDYFFFVYLFYLFWIYLGIVFKFKFKSKFEFEWTDGPEIEIEAGVEVFGILKTFEKGIRRI